MFTDQDIAALMAADAVGAWQCARAMMLHRVTGRHKRHRAFDLYVAMPGYQVAQKTSPGLSQLRMDVLRQRREMNRAKHRQSKRFLQSQRLAISYGVVTA